MVGCGWLKVLFRCLLPMLWPRLDCRLRRNFYFLSLRFLRHCDLGFWNLRLLSSAQEDEKKTVLAAGCFDTDTYDTCMSTIQFNTSIFSILLLFVGFDSKVCEDTMQKRDEGEDVECD